MTEHETAVCERVVSSTSVFEVCALTAYRNDDVTVALKTTNLLARSFENSRISGGGLRIFDAYNEIEDLDTAHFRLSALCGAFSNTVQTIRLQVPYESDPSGLVTLELDLPQEVSADQSKLLAKQTLAFYQKMMDVHYGDEMPTSWCQVTVNQP